MTNTETDAIHLVETAPVQGGNWFFPRNVREDVGYSLQVFTSSGQYRGSVDGERERVRAQNGDLILRVSLGEFVLAFNGQLGTLDHHSRAYHAQVTLRVGDPVRFAISYRQQVVDPVAWARRTIDTNLVNWAATMPNNDITLAMLRYRAERALAGANRTVGLELVSVDSVTADLSAMDTRIVQIQQDEVVRGEQHRVDVVISNEQRQEAEINDEAARQKAALDADAALTRELREGTIRTLYRNYQKQLNDLLQQGYTWDEINDQYPDMVHSLTRLGGFQGQDLLPSGTSSASQSGGSTGTHGNTVLQSDERINPIGASVTAVPLTISQQQAVAQQGMIIDQVFQISKLDAGGPAANANLSIGDLVLQVHGMSFDSSASLRMLLTPNTGMQMTARILIMRSDQLFAADVDVVG